MTRGPKRYDFKPVKCYGCETGKQGYESRRDANRGKKEATKHYGHAMKAYRCPHCEYWHLAHKVRPQTEKEKELFPQGAEPDGRLEA